LYEGETHVLIEIREEHPDDIAAIRDVNQRAFGHDQEGNIVDALRSNGKIPPRVLNIHLVLRSGSFVSKVGPDSAERLT
jgi:predicted N-acetyltransferase YhbS